MIKYYLASSTLPETRASVGRVQLVAAANLDDVIARMVWEHPGLHRADALRILHCYFEAVQHLLLDGRSVNTPLEHFWLSIRGTFTDAEDSFRAGRHAIIPTISPSREMKALIREKAHLEKTEPQVAPPEVCTYLDLTTAAQNSQLTPQGYGEVTGRRLKFDTADVRQGVFFISADFAVIRATSYMILPGMIAFRVPALAPGRYCLEVRAILNKGRAVRAGRLHAWLTVA